MTVTININGKDFEMDYTEIAELAAQARGRTVDAMEQIIKDSKDGMTTSELVKVSGFNASQVRNLMNTLCYCENYHTVTKKHATKIHRFVEIDENNKPIESGKVVEITRHENLYAYTK